MKQLNIILADSDEMFAAKMQERIEEQYGDNADITIINNMRFLADYFSVPRSVDALLIDKGLYFSDIERHSIRTICILTDDPDECARKSTSSSEYIYRFSPLKDICTKLMTGTEGTDDFNKSGCKVLLVTSPIGGCGKTVTALGMAQALKNRGKKVLFIDTGNTQSSSFWLKYSKKLKSDFDIADNLTPESVENIIKKDSFSYVVPMEGTLHYVGENHIPYGDIIGKLRSKEEYDWIVADSPGDFSDTTADLLNSADAVFVMTLQDKFSVYKVNKFLNGVDCSDTDKFFFVCSHYKDNVKNYFGELHGLTKSPEIIPFANMGEAESVGELGELNCFKRLSALLV